MWDFILAYFGAKKQIIGNDIVIRNEKDLFWTKAAAFNLPDVKGKTETDNSADLKVNIIYAFATDLNDEWTVDNAKGREFEIITKTTNISDPPQDLSKGVMEVDFSICLGTRKDELSVIESTMVDILGSIDGIVNFFGGNGNLANSASANRTGNLKQEKNWHSKPKIIKLVDGKLPPNYRDEVSARVSLETNNSWRSFVKDNFYGQKIQFSSDTVPFGFEDFLKLINNSFFNDPIKGSSGVKFIKWGLAADKAEMDWWQREPHTKQLEEISIEPT